MTICVKHVELGDVKVRLDNRLGVGELLLNEIFTASDLTKCRLHREVLVIFDTDNGFKYLTTNPPRGIAFAEKDLDFVTPDEPKKEAIGPHNIEARCEWDYAAYIPKISGQEWKKRKPYFVSVIAHEIEHIRIMINDLNFHRFTSWMYQIFEESRMKCKLQPYQLPWEKHCYKMGKLVAIKICGEKDFNEMFAEYAAILKKYNSNHAEVVEWIQKVDCSETVNEVDWLNILKRKTRQFCQEQKKELSRLYRDDKCRGKKFVQRFNLQDFIGAEA